LKTYSAKVPAKKTDNSAQTTQSKNEKKKESSKKKTQETAVTAPKPTLQTSPAVGSDKKTPTKQHAQSATPLSAVKKSPLQMVKQEHPASFEHTKESFYVHIKVLWGLVKQRVVPQSPPPEQLSAFDQRFSLSDEIQSALAGGPNMIPMDTIQTLKGPGGALQTGQALWCWVPNLDEQPNSLYNEAHCIFAMKSFHQLTAGGA
ncbi:hypothetical protein VP01_7541g1, partial [Puccinia sorghi]